MPSPVGHALGGLAAGWLIAGAGAPPRSSGAGSAELRKRAVLFMALAIAPDFDLFFGSHRTYTHSVGSILIVWLAALAVSRHVPLATACAASWGTHVLFDWLSADSSLPLGIMALWPFSTEFYQSPVAIFMAISRRYWLPGFWAHNGTAVLREVLILAPMVWVIRQARARRARNPQLPSTAPEARRPTPNAQTER